MGGCDGGLRLVKMVVVEAKTGRRISVALAALLATWLAADAGFALVPTGAHCTCAGDCDLDCRTTEVEIGRTVAAIFDPAALAACVFADADGSGRVTAADLVLVLIGFVAPSPDCLGTPPTPSATATFAMATATGTPSRTATPLLGGTPRSRWTALAPLPAGPRQELGVAAVQQTVYAIGGFDGEGLVEAYDVGADRWRPVASLPAPRNHVGAAALDGSVYSVGGFAGLGFQPTREVYRYDPGLDRWQEVAPLPTARGALAVVALNGGVHAIGGSGPGGSVARHDRYLPATDVWAELAPLPTFAARPGARNHLAAAVIDGRIYAVGGRGGPDVPYLDRYDPESNAWEVLAPMPTARSGLAAVAIDGHLVAIGGEVNPAHPRRVFPQVEVYDPASNRWTSLDPMPVPRHGIGAAVVAGLIYVPGGAITAGFDATAHYDALQILW